ncbi:MobF family relaxase [Embleya scabrispora]|uniref:MobF family relaxase n=1 Tax=Embleya scabrispora TaxID=159449 RepID=UPI000376B710|nr:MobF family relaxase [Embleya scabrispora]MYS81034.1 relaxase domain-containing protein [Streptomyces sp. SID5474]
MLTIAPRSDVTYLAKQVARGAEHYHLRDAAIAGEPPGHWLGRGAPDLGLYGTVDHAVLENLYHDFVDPRRRDELAAAIADITDPLGTDAWTAAADAARDTVRLGPRPRDYTTGTRAAIAEALAAEPDATPARRRQIEARVRGKARTAVKYLDLTWSAPKSWSILHAALQLAGRDTDADRVWEAWLTGVRTGLEYLQDNAGFARAGRHGRTSTGASTGRWVGAHRWTVAAFPQHTSRDDDPQLHVHTAVLNRVHADDGAWRTLDSRGIHRHKQAAGHLCERAAEITLTHVLGVEFATRPDRRAREIVGIPESLRARFSSRRRAIAAEVTVYAAKFTAAYGREPSAYELTAIAQHITLLRREDKKRVPLPRTELLTRWAEAAHRDPGVALTDIPAATLHRIGPEDAEHPDRAAIVARATTTLDAVKDAWTRPDLVAELCRRLPDRLATRNVRHLVDDLADQALVGVVRSDPVSSGPRGGYIVEAASLRMRHSIGGDHESASIVGRLAPAPRVVAAVE